MGLQYFIWQSGTGIAYNYARFYDPVSESVTEISSSGPFNYWEYNVTPEGNIRFDSSQQFSLTTETYISPETPDSIRGSVTQQRITQVIFTLDGRITSLTGSYSVEFIRPLPGREDNHSYNVLRWKRSYWITTPVEPPGPPPDPDGPGGPGDPPIPLPPDKKCPAGYIRCGKWCRSCSEFLTPLREIRRDISFLRHRK